MRISTTITRPSGRKALATHRTLVQTTHEVIAETGSFSAEQVADRASMSPATFYSYFPSKDEALAAVLDDALTELVERTLSELQVERLLEDGLRAVVERAVAGCVDVFSSSALVLRLALGRLPESRTIRDVYRDHQRHATAELERFVRLGIAAGRLSCDDERTTTVALLVMLQGLNNPMLLSRKQNDAAVARIVDSIVHLLDPAHAAS